MRPACLSPLLCVCVLGFSGRSARAQLDAAGVKDALDHARISLTEAIDKARAKDNQARFVAAELVTEPRSAYRIQVLLTDNLRTILVDTTDGSLRKPDGGGLEKLEPKRLQTLQRALDEAQLPPERAVQLATRAARDGRVYRLELQALSAGPVYDVCALSNHALMSVEIDAVRGIVVKSEPLRSASAGVTFTFDREDVGRVPAGWSLRQTRPSEPATWAVIADSSATSPPNAFALTHARSDDGTFNLALAEKTSFQDVELVVSAKALTGEQDQGGGVVWRCQDENNYYIARFNPLESNFRVYKVVDGKRKQLHSGSVPTQAGRWYTLRVTMIGDRITCHLDGHKYLEARDDTFPDAGMIGLWTKADAATTFDDLTVRALGAAPATTSAPRSRGGS